jgi:hypothetical protein
MLPQREFFARIKRYTFIITGYMTKAAVIRRVRGCARHSKDRVNEELTGFFKG